MASTDIQPSIAFVTAEFPRRSLLRNITMVLLVAGLLISGYLSYVKLTDVPMVCIQGSIFNCETVQMHPIGKIAGVPIAVLGFLMYLTLTGLHLFKDRHPVLSEYGLMLFFGIVLFGWLYSMWLVYAQFFIIHALCPWCLTHELNITIMFIIIIVRIRRHLAGDTNA